MAGTHKLDLGTWKITYNYHFLICLLVTALVIASVYLTGDSKWAAEDQKTGKNPLASCDLFSGKWVFDNKSYPLYKEQECSFMKDDYACEKFGRKESKYQHWRWQPNDCDLPRFNAIALLEKLRNKRVVFVGDSLNKNQWVSLVCLVESSITDPLLKSSEWKGSLITFTAAEYNASIDFYWEPLLVESNCDDPVNHHIRNRIIRFQAIENHARHWTDADILVFDSFMWWLEPNMTLVSGSIEIPAPDGVYEEVGRLHRYEIALKTWSDWLETHVNSTKTKLFFMSLSPYHKMGEDWGMASGQNCYNETEPISKEGYWGTGSNRRMMRIAEAAIEELETRGLKIQILNITQLSEYRKEAHPSIYRRQWQPPTEEEIANPRTYADCVHWCLPGVPDVWNEILYSYIFHS